jgi:hypothetical protein
MHAVMEKRQEKKGKEAQGPKKEGGKHHIAPEKRPTHLIKAVTTPV